MFYFSEWGFLLLLLVIPLLIHWRRKREDRLEASVRYPTTVHIHAITGGRYKWKSNLLFGLKLVGLLLLIIALARPQRGNVVKEFTTEGIDIMLVLDISTSMQAVDFEPNRLEAAKAVAKNFIEGRINDRIGLTVFAAESFLQCPLTIDYDVLKELLEQVDIIEEKYDGTAIGMAIANAVNRLRDSDAKSKVMILLSDGINNAGEIDPATAAKMAEAFDIKIYTIGLGKKGKAPYPVKLPDGRITYRLVNVEIDEEVLNRIAEVTGGKYFRATDERSLSEIYKEISQMEKSEIKVKEFVNYQEMYPLFLAPGLLLIAISGILGLTIWRRVP